jgi:hypothetical protein
VAGGEEPAVIGPWEELRVADEWAGHFEQDLEAHWTARAKQRGPVLVEPALPAPCRDGAPGAQSRVDGRPGNGQKIPASAWTGMPDVAYHLACLQSVAMGLTKNEVLKASEKARGEAKQSKKPIWVPNPQRGPAGEYLAAGARGKGGDPGRSDDAALVAGGQIDMSLPFSKYKHISLDRHWHALPA